MNYKFFTVLLLWFCTRAMSCEPVDTQAEVFALINAIETSGAQFERNGSVHTAEKAADHLRLKYSRGKKYISSSEDFIAKLASESSFTGKPYWIILEGDKRVKSGVWLTEKLQALRANQCPSGHE
ncbi:hypothetical protein P886_2331 [Alteromonadaceae bacterium 2753L.S.0a.02]|nr:hypothetical protein P886_2331 [Alteromonadaceae bacterium 2753L.S.0a.02]